jgi:hypothetical protein
MCSPRSHATGPQMSGLLRFSKVLEGAVSRLSGMAKTPLALMQQSQPRSAKCSSCCKADRHGGCVGRGDIPAAAHVKAGCDRCGLEPPRRGSHCTNKNILHHVRRGNP